MPCIGRATGVAPREGCGRRSEGLFWRVCRQPGEMFRPPRVRWSGSTTIQQQFLAVRSILLLCLDAGWLAYSYTDTAVTGAMVDNRGGSAIRNVFGQPTPKASLHDITNYIGPTEGFKSGLSHSIMLLFHHDRLYCIKSKVRVTAESFCGTTS